jgi:hypothetical protein
MDIRWAAPPLAKQIPAQISYAGSTKAGAPIYANEEWLHNCLDRLPHKRWDKNRQKMARVRPVAIKTSTRSFLKIR